MRSDALFVWIYLPETSEPVIAGRLDIEHNPVGSVGIFTYGVSYLNRKNAIPIDPVTLPLENRSREFTSLSGFPGAIIDSCPDRWGIKLIDRLEGGKIYPTGYLLMNDPGRAGALAFSTSAECKPEELTSREFTLAELLEAAESVEADRPVNPELLKALHPGTGGARPKCNIVDNDGVWIAKFPSLLDPPTLSIPRLEHATMKLGALCGIRPAETRIEQVGDTAVCLVKRFDRAVNNGQIFRRHFISARSVFYADPTFAQSSGIGSYGRLARWMQRRYGCPPAQRQELYRRMVFNVAIRNSDDHELNHGLLHRLNTDFELVPAYDVVPVLTPHKIHRHALLIGDNAAGTLENLLANTAAFGLTKNDAREIIQEIQTTIQNHWQEVLYEAGLGDDTIRKIECVFRKLE